jgi:hypothetical protein
MKVEDLDVLRPEPRYVRMGGEEIDISYIPCGITFEVDGLVRELSAIPPKNLLKNGEETHKAFLLMVKLCAAFCSWKHPKLDEAWFLDKVDAKQLTAFSQAIQEALTRAYSGIEPDSKNLMAIKTENGMKTENP